MVRCQSRHSTTQCPLFCVWGHCVARSARMHAMCDAKCTRGWFRHLNQTQEASTSPYTYTGLFPKYVQVTQTHKFVAMWDMAHVCCIRLLKPFSLHFFCGHLPLSFIKIVFRCIQTSMKTYNFFKSSPKGRKGRKHKAAQKISLIKELALTVVAVEPATDPGRRVEAFDPARL